MSKPSPKTSKRWCNDHADERDLAVPGTRHLSATTELTCDRFGCTAAAIISVPMHRG